MSAAVLSASGPLSLPNERERSRLRAEFAARRFVRLPGLLAPELLERMLSKLDADSFRASESHSGLIAAEGTVSHEVDFTLTFCVQHPEFFRFIEDVAGCVPIKSFAGRVIKFSPKGKHFLDWHSDNWYDARRIASLSVNLGREPYSGGLLQFRRPRARTVAGQVANTRCGDAVLFSATEEMLHRNTPLRGDRPKIAFSGWFYSDRKAGLTSWFTRERSRDRMKAAAL